MGICGVMEMRVASQGTRKMDVSGEVKYKKGNEDPYLGPRPSESASPRNYGGEVDANEALRGSATRLTPFRSRASLQAPPLMQHLLSHHSASA